MINPDLEPLPARLRKRPIDSRGFPVPWFVAWVGGRPDFRVMDRRKFHQAIKERLCWCCGEPLGRWLAFPIGPMCTITRTISEPPSHRECAEWSIRNCPFLSNPQMVRADHTDLIAAGGHEPAGHGIMRNAGVTCLWITREYETLNARNGTLLTVGRPDEVTWWREGRAATREEVEASIESGLPILFAAARQDGRFAIELLERQVAAARALLPAPPVEAVATS